MSICREVWASAMEMGVFELLTITSATSDIGIAFLLPRGGVGKVLGPGDGAENIIQTPSATVSKRLNVLRLFSSSC